MSMTTKYSIVVFVLVLAIGVGAAWLFLLNDDGTDSTPVGNGGQSNLIDGVEPVEVELTALTPEEQAEREQLTQDIASYDPEGAILSFDTVAGLNQLTTIARPSEEFAKLVDDLIGSCYLKKDVDCLMQVEPYMDDSVIGAEFVLQTYLADLLIKSGDETQGQAHLDLAQEIAEREQLSNDLYLGLIYRGDEEEDLE